MLQRPVTWCVLAAALALASRAAAQVHPEIVVGCDAAGKLVVRFDASRPYPLPASRFPGIDGYAEAMPGISSLLVARPDEDFFPPDPASHLEFVLLGADEGLTVWNDHGTGTMAAGETFTLGTPAFDTHPVWHSRHGTAGKRYTLRLQIRDTTGRHAASDVLAPAFAPDDATELYVCPMSCGGGNTSPQAGRCPECDMQLKLISARSYRVTVTPVTPEEPEAPAAAPAPADETIRAGEDTTLRFALQTPDGGDVRDLQVVHEKLMHLLMVSNDLSWFAHEHPQIQPDGSFLLQFRFPNGGAFTLYHDFTPLRVGMQVVPVELDVAGEAPPPQPLDVSAGMTSEVDGYTVSLSARSPIKSLLSQSLVVGISRDGAPVTDLEPFLGAMGHLIVISEDRSRFVHSHPLAQTPAQSGATGSEPARLTGPEVAFNVLFPAPARYKAWAQFQHAGRVITAPFVFDVVSPYATPAADLVAPQQGSGNR